MNPRHILSLGAALILTAGCAQTTPQTSQQESTQLTSSSSEQAGPAPTAALVGQKKATKDGISYTVTLHTLERSSQTITMSLDLAVDDVPDGKKADTALLSDATDLQSVAKGIPNGIALVDGAGQKLYMPATTTKSLDSAVCGPSLSPSVTRGDVKPITCIYAGIPESVETLTVTIPTFGSFSNVAIR